MRKLIFFFLIIFLTNCKNNEINIETSELKAKIKELDSLNSELISINATIWNAAERENKYLLCDSSIVNDCFVNDHKQAFIKLKVNSGYDIKLNRIKNLQNEIDQYSLNINKNPYLKDFEQSKLIIKDLVQLTLNPEGSDEEIYLQKSNNLRNDLHVILDRINNN